MDAVVDAVPVLGGVVEGVGVLDVPDEMVADGRMPRPVKIDGRVVWDIRRLDAAFDNLVEATAANPLDRLD